MCTADGRRGALAGRPVSGFLFGIVGRSRGMPDASTPPAPSRPDSAAPPATHSSSGGSEVGQRAAATTSRG